MRRQGEVRHSRRESRVEAEPRRARTGDDSLEASTTTRDAGWWLVVAAVAVAGGAALFFAFAPMVAMVEESQTVVGEATSDPMVSQTQETTDSRSATTTNTLAEAQGWESVAVLVVPPLGVAALPLLARGRRSAIALRTIAAVLLWGWVLLGALSFGIFYVPSALLMLVAAILASTHSQASSSHAM